MNPLFVNEPTCYLNVEDRELVIEDRRYGKQLGRFSPRQIPYDAIIVRRPHGSISFGAINWLIENAVSLTILDWKGNVRAMVVPSDPISNELKIAQYKAYLDRSTHLKIARAIVETKIKRQRAFLGSLSKYYSTKIEIPRAPRITPYSEDFMRNQEARYAIEYFKQYGKILREIGYAFRGRNLSKNNMHAPDFPNSLLNYAYGCLKTYVRRAINSVGLDNSIPFVHDLRKQTGLVYDLMEL